MKKNQNFVSENFPFLEVKSSIYLNRHVFVMGVFASRTILFVGFVVRWPNYKGSFIIPHKQTWSSQVIFFSVFCFVLYIEESQVEYIL